MQLELTGPHASLVERAFGRMKIINKNAVSVVDEPFVFKAVENYSSATDPGFQTALKELMDLPDAAVKGDLFERYMMTAFSETFVSRPLRDWPHQHPISGMCIALDNKVGIPSGPDVVFFIRIDGRRIVPVFVQTKLHQSSASLSQSVWDEALAMVSAPCIQYHAKDFRNFCPDKIYISMVVAYPVRCSSRLPPVRVPKVDASGRITSSS
ncbi:hypothetical protein BGZ73_009050 [Actinomortierella ambigua]|nr:hypothetical protein BGZ73_009050 [Actinomortierella ambigua]